MSRVIGTLACLCASLLAAAPAGAANRLTIRGAGWGHGVGMSQWGAYGLARNGAGHRAILRHYYTGTAIGTADPDQTVRVLLDSVATASFTGAGSAGGRKLDPASIYHARRRGSTEVALLSRTGRRLAVVAAPLRVTGPGPLTTGGRRYRGALEIRPGLFGGADVVNALSLEDYVRGVVALESPSTWPIEALKAQAVAARTYAITTARGGTFDHYRDTRSQMYGGVSAESASTEQAVRETRGEVVTYDGRPVVTYFFSTSGGRTESVENTPLGQRPLPWLESVDDPHDRYSPHHRWGPIRLRRAAVERKLRALVKGRFRGIRVVRRGRSPRVVLADVIGTRGRTRTTGSVLRARLGLRDTWAYFTYVATRRARPEEPPASERPREQAAGEGTGGAAPAASASRMVGRRAIATLRGTVVPLRPRAPVVVERRAGGRWIAAGSASPRRDGGYRFAAVEPGRYRVRVGAVTGPVVRVRGAA